MSRFAFPVTAVAVLGFAAVIVVSSPIVSAESGSSTSVSAWSNCWHKFSATSTPPTGFGSAHNVLSSLKEAVIRVSNCLTTEVSGQPSEVTNALAAARTQVLAALADAETKVNKAFADAQTALSQAQTQAITALDQAKAQVDQALQEAAAK